MNTNTALYLSPAGHIDFSELFAGKAILRQLRERLNTRRLKAQIRKERRELSHLPAHLLRDIGVDRAAALQEAKRDFHDIPATRRVD